MSKSAKSQLSKGVDSKIPTSVDRVGKFRQTNPRIDYYPMPDAMAAINWLRERKPKANTRELIDALIIAGKKAISGNICQ